MKKLQDALKSKESKKKKKKKKSKRSDDSDDDDVDQKLSTKLKLLKENPLGLGISTAAPSQKESEKDAELDEILIHKFNKLKNKLTIEDIQNILQNKFSDDDLSSESEEVSR